MDKILLPTVLSDLGQHSLAAAGNTTQLQDSLLKGTLPSPEESAAAAKHTSFSRPKVAAALNRLGCSFQLLQEMHYR